MTILVIAEHSDAQLKSSTLNTLKAAFELGSEVDVLVAGQNCEGAVKQAASVTGVHKVLVAEGEAFNHCLPEALTDAVLAARCSASIIRSMLSLRPRTSGSRWLWARGTGPPASEAT